MRAFLSHSSKDKSIVKQVFTLLGAASTVYDAESFEEGKRNADEISRGIANCDIFVLFLSKNALTEYVKSEIRLAVERHFSGHLRDILIFSIDGTSHTSLPESLQHIIVEHTKNPASIARRIRSRLIELRTTTEDNEIFVGRASELTAVRRAMTLPTGELPPVIAIAGWAGLGRRTLARRAIHDVFPYLKREQPMLVLDENDSVEDFFRKLFDVALGTPRTSDEWQSALNHFAAADTPSRVTQIRDIVLSVANSKEMLFVVGDAALISENGDFQPHIRLLIESLERKPRPQIVLIHRRRVPFAKQRQYDGRVAFFAISALPDEEVEELLGAQLKRREISFMRMDIEDLVPFVGGHPENIRIAAEYAADVGIDKLRKEKADFVDILVFRAREVLKRVSLSETAQYICIALLDFRRLQIEDLISFLNADDTTVVTQLRYLEDHGVLERIGRYYRIAPYLLDTIARSDFADGYDNWRKQVGVKMLSRLKEVSSVDHVSLSLIDAATLAAIRTGKHRTASVVARYLLPSHLLRIAREEYDSRNYAMAIKLCTEALSEKERLPEEAQVEAYRIVAISALRLSEAAEAGRAIEALRRYKGKTARRNEHFLLGFQHRLNGNLDEAEKEYREAYSFDANNFHVLRELAHVLGVQRRYGEAESFARAAYAIAPSNAFIIDILCEVVIGARTTSQLQSDVEVRKLLRELEELNTSQSMAFVFERKAQLCMRLDDPEDAWRNAIDAVNSAPNHFGPRMTRIDIALRLRRFEFMGEDLAHFESGFRGGDRFTNRPVVDRAKIAYEIARGNLVKARQLLDAAFSMPRHIQKALRQELRESERSRAGTGTERSRGARQRGQAAGDTDARGWRRRRTNR